MAKKSTTTTAPAPVAPAPAVITLGDVANAAAALAEVTGGPSALARFHRLGAVISQCGDSLDKKTEVVQASGALLDCSRSTVQRLGFAGIVFGKDASEDGIARAYALHGAVGKALNGGISTKDVKDAFGAVATVAEALDALAALTAVPEVEDGEGDEGEGEGGEDAAPEDKSLTYLQQAETALSNFVSKGTPSREHEGLLDILLAKVQEALDIVRALPLPGQVEAPAVEAEAEVAA